MFTIALEELLGSNRTFCGCVQLQNVLYYIGKMNIVHSLAESTSLVLKKTRLRGRVVVPAGLEAGFWETRIPPFFTETAIPSSPLVPCCIPYCP